LLLSFINNLFIRIWPPRIITIPNAHLKISGISTSLSKYLKPSASKNPIIQ